MKFAVLSLAAFALASCAGGPATQVADLEAAGACSSLPEGVTCECVVTTAQAALPTIKAPRDSNETGSRLGRGKVGGADPRLPIAIESAKQSCASGKAVG